MFFSRFHNTIVVKNNWLLIVFDQKGLCKPVLINLVERLAFVNGIRVKCAVKILKTVHVKNLFLIKFSGLDE